MYGDLVIISPKPYTIYLRGIAATLQSSDGLGVSYKDLAEDRHAVIQGSEYLVRAVLYESFNLWEANIWGPSMKRQNERAREREGERKAIHTIESELTTHVTPLRINVPNIAPLHTPLKASFQPI